MRDGERGPPPHEGDSQGIYNYHGGRGWVMAKSEGIKGGGGNRKEKEE